MLAPASTSTPPFAIPAQSRVATTPKATLLLIEDQAETITAVRLSLGRDCEIQTATPASLATGLLEDRVFDVILTSLANAAGIGATIQVKRTTDTPVIALVGGRDYFQTVYQLRMATTLGAVASVMKPVAAERLRVAVSQACSRAIAC
jgi:DNA-binding NtrC family response regulator